MASPATINPRIIEGLYCEALVLSDEVRSAFIPHNLSDPAGPDAAQDNDRNEDEATIARSCEALRTTTRMMHAVAWLLNHRAFCKGELSEFQLRRHGKLVEFPEGDPARLALLDPQTRALVLTTQRFHARLKRIDNGWRERDPGSPSAVARLRDRITAVPPRF
ncbi:MAG: hypothetical protein RLZZ84_944 [Pseudomonadota bacterium]|jgi:regulator of CtrA degradation